MRRATRTISKPERVRHDPRTSDTVVHNRPLIHRSKPRSPRLGRFRHGRHMRHDKRQETRRNPGAIGEVGDGSVAGATGRRRCGIRSRLRRRPIPRPPRPPRPGLLPPAPSPSPPTPPDKRYGYGPSCFFPTHALAVLLAPATAALLAVPSLILGVPLTRTAVPAMAEVAKHGADLVGMGRRTVQDEAGRRDEAGGPAEQPGLERAWPVEGPAGIRPTVLHGWEPPPSPWAAGHRGVDLASPTGATVRSAAPGRVAYAGTVAGRGVLSIEVSRSGRPPLRTTYEPVRPTVRKGQRVTAGQPVAVLQRGPFHCRAPCLHWGLRRGRTYQDPLSLLPAGMRSGGPSRLLPVFGVPLPSGGRTVPRGPETPEPTAQEGTQNQPVAGLMGAVVLAVAALWALGRLTPRRSTRREEGTGERSREPG